MSDLFQTISPVFDVFFAFIVVFVRMIVKRKLQRDYYLNGYGKICYTFYSNLKAGMNMAMEKVIGFLGPEQENGFLSNRFPSYFDYAGLTYSSAEQFLMAQKAIVFGDYEMYNEILLEHDPEVIRDLGQEVLNYDDAVWANLRQRMLRRGLRAKFQQNPALLQQLLETGDSLLAFCAAEDKLWGIGLDVSDPNVQDPQCWQGENLLGETLMQVREDLKAWTAKNGDVQYIDAIDAEPNAVWNMPVKEAKELPAFRAAMDIYFDITLYRLHGDRFFYDGCSLTLAELETIIAGEMGGGLPAAWFFEMKQDMYDIYRFEAGRENA